MQDIPAKLDSIKEPIEDHFPISEIHPYVSEHVSESTLYRLAKTGKLQTFPGTYLVPAQIAVRFILDGTVNPAEAFDDRHKN